MAFLDWFCNFFPKPAEKYSPAAASNYQLVLAPTTEQLSRDALNPVWGKSKGTGIFRCSTKVPVPFECSQSRVSLPGTYTGEVKGDGNL